MTLFSGFVSRFISIQSICLDHIHITYTLAPVIYINVKASEGHQERTWLIIRLLACGARYR